MYLFLIESVLGLEILSSIVLPYPANSSEKRVVSIDLDPGTYQFEVWGAQGGKGAEAGRLNDKAYGGYGAYATAYIKFNEKRTVYCYFGQQGSDANPKLWERGRDAFNGGGKGGYDDRNSPNTAGGGSGGTDCRLYAGDIVTDFRSRHSRFVVAGGGSGGGGNCHGAPGGGFYTFKLHEPEYAQYVKREMTHETSRSGIGDGGSQSRQGKKSSFLRSRWRILRRLHSRKFRPESNGNLWEWLFVGPWLSNTKPKRCSQVRSRFQRP